MKTKQKLILVAVGAIAIVSCFMYERLNYAFGRHILREKEATVKQIAEHMKREGATIRTDKLRSIATMVYNEAADYSVDYRLVLAIMKVESNFRHDAVSSKGARGLLQVKPSLAKFIANDIGIQWRGPKTLDEPDKNIKIGVHLFSALVNDFDNISMALDAYHVGPTRLKEILTKNRKPDDCFINAVLGEYRRVKTLLPDPQR